MVDLQSPQYREIRAAVARVEKDSRNVVGRGNNLRLKFSDLESISLHYLVDMVYSYARVGPPRESLLYKRPRQPVFVTRRWPHPLCAITIGARDRTTGLLVRTSDCEPYGKMTATNCDVGASIDMFISL